MTLYDDALVQYVNQLFIHKDPTLEKTIEASQAQGLPAIQVKPEEGRFLQFLVSACGVQKAVEFGTLGGYSSICIARGLAPGGRLVTCEAEPHHALVARQNLAVAGVADRVEVRVGDAHTTMQSLRAEGPFDFVFIDAEKTGYMQYLDWTLENLRPGGLFAAHNAFRKGAILAQTGQDEKVLAMQAFNRRVAAEPRLLSTIFPAGDGTVIAVKVR